MAVIRLLLLTGCRKGEILALRRSDYREGRLFLRDSITGPRMVWLSDPARRILDSLEPRGRWMFPASCRDRPLSGEWLDLFWRRLRAEADPDDVRLHDLRHTHPAGAFGEETGSPDPYLQPVHQLVEPPRVGDPVNHAGGR